MRQKHDQRNVVPVSLNCKRLFQKSREECKGTHILRFSRRQSDQELDAVGLRFCLVRGAVAVDLPAFGTAVNDHVAFARVGLYADRLHWRAALVGAVSGVDIHVQGPQAKRAMVARGIAQRQDLFFAVRADESAVVFGKAFLLHFRASPFGFRN